MAPEMLMEGEISAATDVFSFGVVLLELATGRMPVDANQQPLSSWAEPLLASQRWEDLIDPAMRNAWVETRETRSSLDNSEGCGASAVKEKAVPRRSVLRCFALASACLNFDPLMRPSMEDVAMALQALHTSASAERTRAPHLTRKQGSQTSEDADASPPLVESTACPELAISKTL
eukprot:TRINITY_DN58217_c0_g1_i1.p1 TRINITY_DN58217_c0_g1~~TRINITY_DN58217_c0_g1_i1.p1  ORF type:complete len:189 (-),score=11.49 TRINITY_DN58217_c0_g1_i1:47-574(-)